jgi:GTPase SAR1 family protein
MPHTPIILVGTKMDLRTNTEVIARLALENQKPIAPADGQRLAEELGAAKYLECSALTQQGLKAVFDEAIKTAMQSREKPKDKGGKKCAVM